MHITKYNSVDGKVVLEASDDAVTAAWGDGWRTPTRNEYVALCNAVNAIWTNNYKCSGVAGLVCTDKKDSSKILFFPACGLCYNGSVCDVGICGYYWSSSLCGNSVQHSYYLFFNRGYVGWQDICIRRYGFPVRAVMK